MGTLFKIVKWLVVTAAVVLVLIAAMVAGFIYSKDLRQNVFPLSYRLGKIDLECQDLVVTAADTSHLMGVKLQGDDFLLQVPDVELHYRPYPPELEKVILNGPDLKIKVNQRGGDSSMPYRSIRQAARLIFVRNGSVQVSWQGGEAEVKELGISPVVGKVPEQGILTAGNAEFFVVSGKQEIIGYLNVALEDQELRLNIDAQNVKVNLPGFEPIDTDVHVKTGLMPGDLGVLDGYAEIENAVSLLPRSVIKSSDVGKELLGAGPIPARIAFHFDVASGIDARGSIALPLMSPLEKLKISASLDVEYDVKISPDFKSGKVIADVPAISTKLTGQFQTREKGVTWSAKADCRVKNYSFYLDDNHALEGLSGRVNLELEGVSPAGGGSNAPVSWKFNARWDKGDLLVYPWYFDLSADASGGLDARGRVAGKRVRLKSAVLKSFITAGLHNITLVPEEIQRNLKAAPVKTLKRLLSGKAQAEISGPIENTYRILVRDPFEAGHAVLSRLKPEGRFAVRINSLGADIGVNADIGLDEKKIFRGVRFEGTVPFGAGICRPALLSWDKIVIPSEVAGIGKVPQGNHASGSGNGTERDVFLMDSGSLSMETCSDRIRFGPVRIPAGKGTVEIGRGEIAYSGGKVRLTDVNIQGLVLSARINNSPVEASLNGRNLVVELENGRINIKGTVYTDFARGKVEISRMWLEFFGPVPRFGADVVLKNIDLATITELTDFGKVTGRLDGKVKNLVISGKQPESFELELRSRKVRGVDQEISIKAIRNLSILGGGGGGIPLLGQFFKNFSYSSIAVSCRLKNDIFTIHGLIREGNTEYLVKRGFWGGVNVINQNPGGKISFSDMLERLARITESGKAKIE